MKPVLCALGAFLVLALSIPSQLVLLAWFPGALGVVLSVILALVACLAGSYLMWAVYEYMGWRKSRKHGKV